MQLSGTKGRRIHPIQFHSTQRWQHCDTPRDKAVFILPATMTYALLPHSQPKGSAAKSSAYLLRHIRHWRRLLLGAGSRQLQLGEHVGQRARRLLGAGRQQSHLVLLHRRGRIASRLLACAAQLSVAPTATCNASASASEQTIFAQQNGLILNPFGVKPRNFAYD